MTRIKQIGLGVAITAATVVPATTALAGHCADNGGPGHSDFAQHVQDNPHNEGGHQGWSSCEDQARSGDNNPGRGRD